MAKKTTFWQGWLVDNPLTEDPNDFTLKVKAGNMVTTEDIAKALQAEGKTPTYKQKKTFLLLVNFFHYTNANVQIFVTLQYIYFQNFIKYSHQSLLYPLRQSIEKRNTNRKGVTKTD